ncbi:MAG: hypothetical protein JO345_09935 [Streptosporangiaceae bacterium]|nr:hypothetical protein [Streptosporangiaceae bacterium]
MSTFRKSLFTAVASAATAATVIGVAASPAFAKSDTTLSGPRVVHAGQPFRLTVSVGDDGGARPASARLQISDRYGHFHWSSNWQRLRRANRWDESYTFTLPGAHRGRETLRAVVTGYATTNTIVIVVR